MKSSALTFLFCIIFSSLHALSSWSESDAGYCVIANLRSTQKDESSEYKKYWLFISKNGKIKTINEQHFMILNTQPKSLTIGHYNCLDMIKKFHFDDKKGIIEIEFHNRDDWSDSTQQKLIITRGIPRDSQTSKEYPCNASLSYQTKFNEKGLKILGKPNDSLNLWIKHEYTGVDDILLPSAKVCP